MASDDDGALDERAPVGRTAAAASGEPRTSAIPEPSLFPPPLNQSPAQSSRFQGTSSVVLAGPTGVGKTLWLCSVGEACASNSDEPPWLNLAYESEMASLILQGYQKDSDRRGLDATSGVQEYTFTVEAIDRGIGGSREGIGQRLGVKTFSCLDGPGGALFHEDLNNTKLDDAMLGYRRRLLEAGRRASSIVFLVNPIRRSTLAGNMTLLLGDLASRVQVPVEDNGHAPGWLAQTIRRWRGLPRVRAHPPRTEEILKLNADRVLFVFNHIDQVCAAWQATWRREKNAKGDLTALQIAQQELRPVDLALDLLGARFLQGVQGFLKEEATLAVAVCSAGGFTEQGDPFRDPTGRMNVLRGIDPRVAEQRRRLFGVRETVLFAGFGITTPAVVEKIPFSRLAVERQDRGGVRHGRLPD